MTNPDFKGQEPSPEQEQIIKATADHWRKIGNDAPVQAIARIEDTAKQLININGVLQGLYFTIYAFSDLREQTLELKEPFPGQFLLILFFLPVVLWLISLFYATRVFVPQTHKNINLNNVHVSSWQELQNAYGHIQNEKLKSLHRAHNWLIGSFGVLLALLFLLVFLPTTPARDPTEVIILTPTIEATTVP